MREMKDSGLQWAGDIPQYWNIAKGKHFMAVLERPVRDDDNVITCFRDGEVTLRSNRREDGFTVATVEAGYQGIEPGDLVVHGMDDFAGAIGISDSRGKGTPALNVLSCSENKKYIMYLLRAMAYTEVFMALSTGIRVRTCDTNWKKLKSLDYLIPPADEQQCIADFLDAKCAEIDALTADIQTQIDTLEQYKRSVITETVTKGLNPNAEMKDSGIQWIGNMPAHWDVVRGKYILHYMQKPVREDDGVITCFRDGEVMNRLYEKFILEYYAKECPQVTATASQIQWALDDGISTMLPVMQSDIMLTRGNEVLIIDAKYYTHTTQTQYDVHTLHSGNLYQIFTYVKNKEAEFGNEPHQVSGMLLYAATDEAIQPDNRYRMSGNQISVKTLDLNRNFSEISAQLNRIVEDHFL